MNFPNGFTDILEGAMNRHITHGITFPFYVRVVPIFDPNPNSFDDSLARLSLVRKLAVVKTSR
jgi:hypothetical protein